MDNLDFFVLLLSSMPLITVACDFQPMFLNISISHPSRYINFPTSLPVVNACWRDLPVCPMILVLDYIRL